MATNYLALATLTGDLVSDDKSYLYSPFIQSFAENEDTSSHSLPWSYGAYSGTLSFNRYRQNTFVDQTPTFSFASPATKTVDGMQYLFVCHAVFRRFLSTPQERYYYDSTQQTFAIGYSAGLSNDWFVFSIFRLDRKTITFDRNGGAGGTGSIAVAYNEVMPTIVPPTFAGKGFLGYFTTRTGGAKVFNSDGTPVSERSSFSANTTLYAHWGAIVTITFDKQGGTEGTDSIVATEGSSFPDIRTPSRFNHEFKGYFTSATGGDEIYDLNGLPKLATVPFTEDTTLYARWQKNPAVDDGFIYVSIAGRTYSVGTWRAYRPTYYDVLIEWSVDVSTITVDGKVWTFEKAYVGYQPMPQGSSGHRVDIFYNFPSDQRYESDAQSGSFYTGDLRFYTDYVSVPPVAVFFTTGDSLLYGVNSKLAYHSGSGKLIYGPAKVYST